MRSGEQIRRTLERAGYMPDLPAAYQRIFVNNAERLRTPTTSWLPDRDRGARDRQRHRAHPPGVRAVLHVVAARRSRRCSPTPGQPGDAEPLATFGAVELRGRADDEPRARDIEPMLDQPAAAAASALHAYLGDTPHGGCSPEPPVQVTRPRDSRRARSGAVGGARPVGAARRRPARRPLPEADRAAAGSGLVMAFGAGALISAITTDLVAEAYHEAGRAPAGSVCSSARSATTCLTTWLDRRAEREDPEEPVEEAADVRRRRALPRGADATAAATSPSAWCSTASRSRSPSGSRCSAAAACRSRWSARCSSRTCPRRSASPPRCSPAASRCATCCSGSAPSSRSGRRRAVGYAC